MGGVEKADDGGRGEVDVEVEAGTGGGSAFEFDPVGVEPVVRSDG